MKNYVCLVYSGQLSKFKQAVKTANEILRDPQFYDKLRDHSKFDSDELSANVLANLMEKEGFRIHTRANLTPFGIQARVQSLRYISVSYWKCRKDLKTAVNLLVQETANLFDRQYSNRQNKIINPGTTMAWVAGAIAELMVNKISGGDDDSEMTGNDSPQ